MADIYLNIEPSEKPQTIRVEVPEPPAVISKAEALRLVKSQTILNRLIELGLQPLEENPTRQYYRRETVEHFLRMLDNQKR